MKCDKTEQLYQYIDGQMSQSQSALFSEHLNHCEECKRAYDEMRDIKKELGQYAKQIPDAQVDMEKIFMTKEKERRAKQKDRNGMRQKILFIAKKSTSYAAVLVLGIALYALLSGMFGGYNNGANYRNVFGMGSGAQVQKDAMTAESSTEAGGASDKQAQAPEDKEIPETLMLSPDKIIYTGNMVVEVNKYDEARQMIGVIVEESQSFIQSEEVRISERGGYEYYTSDYKIRVPVAQYQSVMQKLKEIGSVKYSVQQASNITYEYRDIQGNIEQLNIQKQRLLSLYQQTSKISELIEIENELTRLNTQIKDYENMLINYDREVEYSTIQLSISEIVSENALVNPFANLGKKIKEAFVNSINALTTVLVFLFLLLIKILPFAIGAAAIFFFVRWVMKRKKMKNE